jgi:hypothetical protein
MRLGLLNAPSTVARDTKSQAHCDGAWRTASRQFIRDVDGERASTLRFLTGFFVAFPSQIGPAFRRFNGSKNGTVIFQETTASVN